MSMDQSYMWHSYVYHFTPSVYIYFQICFGKTLRYNHNKIYGMLWTRGGDCIILISTYKEINMLGNCPVSNCANEFSSKWIRLLMVDCWIEFCNSDHLAKDLGS